MDGRTNKSMPLFNLKTDKQQSVSVNGLRLIAVLEKFDVVRTRHYVRPRREALRANKLYASFKGIKFPRGDFQTDSQRKKHSYCFYCSTQNIHLTAVKLAF